MDIFKRFTSGLLHKPQIPEEINAYCTDEIRKVNQSRFRYLAPLVILALVAILAVYAYDAFRNGLQTHLLMYIVTDAVYLLILTCCYLLFQTGRLFTEARFNTLLILSLFVSLLWTIVLSILDLNMTTFIMALLLFSIVFAIKPRVFLCVQLLVLLPLLILFPFLKIDSFALQVNYINVIFCSFLSCYMSRIIYNSALESVANRQIIECKNEELSQMVVHLKDLSETDALTMLLNRRKFNEIMKIEWRRALRNASGLVLIIIDVDFFKNYNDAYGHLKGDDCLTLVGKTLREKFMRANEYVARYGGEEFALVMSNTDTDAGIIACERLLEAVSALKIPHSQSRVADYVTVSAGMMAVVPGEGDRVEDFINKADLALYRAKVSGRNQFYVSQDD